MKLAEVVSTGRTFDGAVVFLHADGAISSYSHVSYGGCLPADTMWRHWQDVCLYTWAELADFIRAAKKAAKKSAKVPRSTRAKKAAETTVGPVARGAIGALVPYTKSAYGALPVGLMVDEAGQVFDMRPNRARLDPTAHQRADRKVSR